MVRRKEIIDKLDSAFTIVNYGKVYRNVINEVEKFLIEGTLKKTNGNQIVAARILGVNRNTLRMKIRKLKISTQQFK